MDVVYATGNFVAYLPDGGMVRVNAGTHWPVDDPIVVAHPDGFSADPRVGMHFTGNRAQYDDAPVEQATAAPGEKRNTQRRA